MPPPHSVHSLIVATAATLLFFPSIFTSSFCYGAADFSGCDRTFSCGSISSVTFPFTGGDRPDHCGLPEFRLSCQPATNLTLLTNNDVTYRVLHLNQTLQRLTLSRSDLYNNTCPSQFVNSTLNSTFFSFGDQDNEVLTIIYGCNSTAITFRPHNLFQCTIPTTNFSDAYYIVGPLPTDPILRFVICSVSVTVPLLSTAGASLTSNQTNLAGALMEGFVVNYTHPYEYMCSECTAYGGLCGFDLDSGEAVCICGDRPCPLPALPPQNGSESHLGTLIIFESEGSVKEIFIFQVANSPWA